MYGLYCLIQTGLVIIEIVNKEHELVKLVRQKQADNIMKSTNRKEHNTMKDWITQRTVKQR